MVKFIDDFITKIARRSAANHAKDINEYFNSLDYDTQLAYFSMLLAKNEEERVRDGQADFSPLKEIIRKGIETSISEGHSIDGLISYYLCSVNELLDMKMDIGKEIKNHVKEENRKFFP